MEDKTTKTQLAKNLGIARQTLYYQSKLKIKDWNLKTKIEEVLHKYPSYGHRRIALHLQINKKCILRVMNLFGIKPYRRRPEKLRKKRDEGKQEAPFKNLLLNNFPYVPHIIWVSDFTHIKFKGRWIYLATVMDLYTRSIVGFQILTAHSTDLVLGALLSALTYYPTPKILHSDQGSEYKSKKYVTFVNQNKIQISMSRKACPWENGYQESFYSQFKVDLGDPNRFEYIGELIVAIYQTIFIYNNFRIHTSLKMPPVKYYERYLERSRLLVHNVS